MTNAPVGQCQVLWSTMPPAISPTELLPERSEYQRTVLRLSVHGRLTETEARASLKDCRRGPGDDVELLEIRKAWSMSNGNEPADQLEYCAWSGENGQTLAISTEILFCRVGDFERIRVLRDIDKAADDLAAAAT